MPEANLRILSFLSPDIMREFGQLPREAICGWFTAAGTSPDTFRVNPLFVNFMHQVIKRAGLLDPAVQAAAAEQRDGYVYVIDLRTPDGPQGQVPIEDVVGSFMVRDGILDGSYSPNDKHVVYSRNGLVRLAPSLQAALISAWKNIALERR